MDACAQSVRLRQDEKSTVSGALPTPTVALQAGFVTFLPILRNCNGGRERLVVLVQFLSTAHPRASSSHQRYSWSEPKEIDVVTTWEETRVRRWDEAWRSVGNGRTRSKRGISGAEGEGQGDAEHPTSRGPCRCRNSRKSKFPKPSVLYGGRGKKDVGNKPWNCCCR